ncbi:hypothetical protein V498_08179 [Pseudogymnoascus sp. VKM F-4517 (FW-2822)]|nr:hypothetical protein V498_08179 [Pseudogymnoascus sp. VKM F-4517 (FW-2822)]
MDFWSRLIAGTSLSPSTPSKAAFNDPVKRLARFRREYSQLLQEWRHVTNLSKDTDTADTIRACLRNINKFLSDESRLPSPHPCLSFSAQNQIYVSAAKIATVSYNEDIIREAITLFSTLIESEEEDFIENDAFSQSLMNLLARITGANSIRLNSETEVDVIELAFGIAAKIRLQPEILPAWFTTGDVSSDDEDKGHHERFTGKTSKEDFPLFYLLVDYIHHEGRIGDFARTGLLYIIESASVSMPLEQWLVESDLATLMATGLGALYSQLSRKLVIDYPEDNFPLILAMSDFRHPRATADIVSSTSTDFQGHMDTFLSHLVFWQDVLDHCKSVEVRQTLLEHFQVIFLQQLLYPSLLESSDADGGSSVAVLTYLRRVLESVEHPDMIHLILNYLLALPDTTMLESVASTKSLASEARKRKSMNLATMGTQQSTPDLFNLVDLIIGSLRSKSIQTITVTLQLFSVILRRHHRYAVSTLLRTARVVTDGPQKLIGAHQMELTHILDLANDISVQEGFDEIYEGHIKDATNLLESHPCSHQLIAPVGISKPSAKQPTIPGAPQDVHSHTLRPDDPILKTLLSLLSTFFTNSVETNLALTEALIDLAICGYMNVEGWLLPDPSKYTYPTPPQQPPPPKPVKPGSQAATELAHIQTLREARRRPNLPAAATPPLLLTLRALVAQTTTYRSAIPRFDDLLHSRRQAFKLDAESPPPPTQSRTDARGNRRSSDSDRSSSPPAQRRTPPASTSRTRRLGASAAIDSLASRIFPELASRSSSPLARGRTSREQKRSGHGTPSGRRVVSNSPLRASETAGAGSLLDEDGAAWEAMGSASQSAAYAHIDRGILTRRVGMAKIVVGESGGRRVVDTEIIAPSTPAGSTAGDGEGDEEGSVVTSRTDETGTETGTDREEEVVEKMVSVSHVLTNIIVLQEFILELAALVQVRAAMFGEVKFT